MKSSNGHGYYGRYRKGMYDGSGGKTHLRAYEGIFSKLNWNARKGGRNIPHFSFFQAQEDFRTGICKLCMTQVKVFYSKYNNKPFLVNIEDKQNHRKWIGSGGWHCIIPKSDKPKEESETMKRLKGKKWKPNTDDDCFMWSLSKMFKYCRKCVGIRQFKAIGNSNIRHCDVCGDEE